MRKRYGIVAGLLCCMMCVLKVRADVIWEPMEDSFYERHREACTYVGRQYTANGPDGVVYVYKSPESAEVVETWENGYQVRIGFTYEDSDGIVWGINENYTEKCGWMPMEYMEVVYDSISFVEEYAEEIVSQEGQLENYEGEEFFFWSYPGSKEYISVTNPVDPGEYDPVYRSVYTDENGRRWGHVGYFYGYRDKWFCIDAPGADYEELYPEGGPQRGNSPEGENRKEAPVPGPEGEEQEDREPAPDPAEDLPGTGKRTERIVPKTGGRDVVTAVVMVVATVAVTAGLLIALKRRKD